MTSIGNAKKEEEHDDETVIVFGSTGVIGTCLIEILSKEHPRWKILAVTRSISKKSRLNDMNLPNVTMVQGNPSNRESVLQLTTNCTKIYSCIGLHKYETKYWSEQWPLIVDNLLEATIARDNGNSKQRRQLIFCDNLYAYGNNSTDDTDGTKMISASTKRVEPSLFKTKPAVRSYIHEKFQQHMQSHPKTLVVVGSSDFFGPYLTETSVLGDIVTGKIINGGKPMVLCAANKKHSFSYAPDLAKAMAIAGDKEKAYDRFWICPHSIQNKTMNEIVNDIGTMVRNQKEEEEEVNKSKSSGDIIKVQVLPTFLLGALGLFSTMMKELYQMKDFWRYDYVVDDTTFCNEFHVQATPYNDALNELVSFYLKS